MRHCVVSIFIFLKRLMFQLIKGANGEVTSAKFCRPLNLIYYEYFINKEDINAREEFLKSGVAYLTLSSYQKDI